LSKAGCIIVKIHCQRDLHHLSKSIYRRTLTTSGQKPKEIIVKKDYELRTITSINKGVETQLEP